MKKTRKFAVLLIVLLFLAAAWRYSSDRPESRHAPDSTQVEIADGTDSERSSGFFRPPSPQRRKAERNQKIATATFPNGSLFSEEDYFSEPQTNVFTSSLRIITVITPKLVNTNAFLARMEADELTNLKISQRLAEIRSEAASLTAGMPKAEVLRLFTETPSQTQSNHVVNCLIYSPHPERILPSLMDGRFEVLYVVFATNNRVAKFGYSSRLEGFWWVMPVR